MKNSQLIFLLFIFILVSVLLETTLLNFPFVLLTGLSIAVFVRKIPMFITVFILGFIVDSLRVSYFGMTSLMIFGTVILLFLYEKYLGNKDFLVSSFFIAIATCIYSYFLNYSLFAVLLFFGLFISVLFILDFLKKKGKIFI